ncbi:MAG: DUF3796 domain-containing protein [Syntrophomonadaceae bacterium]|nr:DUF3796 domain-containing protein [Syntrophomonadaceae bacterium]
MSKGWLKYLGFLGLLGLLGPITNPGFYGFFGFFGFFGFARLVNDERLEYNVNRSARNSFLASLIIYPAAVVYAALFPSPPASTVYAFAFALNFGLLMLVFALSLIIYDHLGE